MIKKLDFIQDYKNFKYKTVKLGDSDDNNSDKTNDEIDKNSKTGDALIQFVWIIGICALGYSIYYFKNKKQEN